MGSQDHVRWIVDRGSWRIGLPGGTEHRCRRDGCWCRRDGYHFAASPGSAVRILVLPAAEILHGPDRAASGAGDTPEARLLTAHAATVGRMLDDLGRAGRARRRPRHPGRAGPGRGAGRGRRREPGCRRRWQQAARDLADRRLTDPALTPTVIAGELNVSVRTLQRAFAGEEHSLSAYIRERRLEGARRALLATGRRASVADVAARWQFADGGHFAGLFRRRYGQTPTEYARATAVTRPRHRPGRTVRSLTSASRGR